MKKIQRTSRTLWARLGFFQVSDIWEKLRISNLPHHQPAVCHHRQRDRLVGRKPEPEGRIRLDEPYGETIREIRKNESVKTVFHPPCALCRSEAGAERREEYSQEEHFVEHGRVARDAVSEIDSPRKRSREAVGEIPDTQNVGAYPSGKDAGNDSRKEKHARRSGDAEIFLDGLRRNHASENRARDGLGNEDGAFGVPARNHESVEGRNERSAEHGARDDRKVVVPADGVGRKLRAHFAGPEDTFTKIRRNAKSDGVSREIEEDFRGPVSVRHH